MKAKTLESQEGGIQHPKPTQQHGRMCATCAHVCSPETCFVFCRRYERVNLGNGFDGEQFAEFRRKRRYCERLLKQYGVILEDSVVDNGLIGIA